MPHCPTKKGRRIMGWRIREKIKIHPHLFSKKGMEVRSKKSAGKGEKEKL